MKRFGIAWIGIISMAFAGTASADALVRIKASGTLSEVTRVAAGEAVSFSNESTRSARVVVFHGEGAMACDSGEFTSSAEATRSRWLRPTDVAGSCRLEPGSYRIEVSLTAGNTQTTSGQSVREATIEAL